MSFTHRKFFHHAPPPYRHHDQMGLIYEICAFFFLAVAFHFGRLCYLRVVRSWRWRSNSPLRYRSRDGFFAQARVPEAVSAGLQQSTIDSIIGQRKYRGGETECCCCVCQFEFEDDESVRVLPNCGHVYHVPCIDPWLRFRDNCPLCRALVSGYQETEHGGALFLNVTGGDGFDRNLDSATSIRIDEDGSGDGVVELEVEIGEPMGTNRENLDSKLKRCSSFSDCGRSRLCRVLTRSASFPCRREVQETMIGL